MLVFLSGTTQAEENDEVYRRTRTAGSSSLNMLPSTQLLLHSGPWCSVLGRDWYCQRIWVNFIWTSQIRGSSELVFELYEDLSENRQKRNGFLKSGIWHLGQRVLLPPIKTKAIIIIFKRVCEFLYIQRKSSYVKSLGIIVRHNL